MSEGRMSIDVLRLGWPQTCQTLQRTYYPGEGFGRSYSGHLNDAGYIVAALEAYASSWAMTHGHHGVSRQTLDAAAAAEIQYHWTRGRQFRRAVSALGKAICNLVTERPERILQLHRGASRRYQGTGGVACR